MRILWRRELNMWRGIKKALEELLTGHKIDYPPAGQVNITFRKALKGKRHREVSF